MEKFMGMDLVVMDALLSNEELSDLCALVETLTRLRCLFHLFQDTVEKLK